MQVSVGSHCVDCAKASRPDLATRARFWSAGQHNLVTYTLIAANVLVFIGVILWTGDMAALTGQLTTAHLDLGLSKEVLAEPIAWNVGEGCSALDYSDCFVTQPDGWYRLMRFDLGATLPRVRVTTWSSHYRTLSRDLESYAAWYKAGEQPKMSDEGFHRSDDFEIVLDGFETRFGPPMGSDRP